jgi:hypothetical protein
MRWGDLDHYMVNNTYRDAYDMTKEQKYWFSTIFGMTYQSEMTWIIFNSFPDFESIDIKDVVQWNDDNYSRQWYSRDTKYNKGRIAEQIESIQNVVKPYGSLTNYYDSCITDDLGETYEKLQEAVMKFQKFGRMTSWLTCQVLFETADFPAKPNNMLATDPSNWSVRSGLMYLHGHDDLIEAKNKEVKLTKDDLKMVNKYELELYDKVYNYISDDLKGVLSYYLIESHLCQYKKLMLGGDYSGHSSCDHQKRADRLSELWEEIDFNPFYDMVETKYYPLVRNQPDFKPFHHLCAKTGQMVNMHTDFKDMPDMYKELNIPYQSLDENRVFCLIDNYSNDNPSLEKFF